MTTKVLCPDCGSECAHALTMPVECERCVGAKFVWILRLTCCGRDDGVQYARTEEEAEVLRDAYTSGPGVAAHGYSSPEHQSGHRRSAVKERVPCPDCNGTGKVQPPPPTDEQILGRECEDCDGSGEVESGVDGSVQGVRQHRCPSCNGAGRFGAAENRWTCLGCQVPWEGVLQDPASRQTFDLRYADHRQAAAAADHRLSHAEMGISRERCCPGRTDVQATPDLWAEIKRAWRTRTKTTVLDGYHQGYAGVREMPLPAEWCPEDACYKRGKWTVVVTFEPEDER